MAPPKLHDGKEYMACTAWQPRDRRANPAPSVLSLSSFATFATFVVTPALL